MIHGTGPRCRTSTYLWLGLVGLYEHLAEFLQLLRATDFFREERKLYYVEEFVVEFVRFIEVLLLHRMPDPTVFTIRIW